MQTIVVVGWGAWATTLVVMLGQKFANNDAVSLRWWIRPDRLYNGQSLLKVVEAQRENPKRLPGIPIPPKVRIVGALQEAIAEASAVIFAVPSTYVAQTACQVVQLPDDAIIIHATKGLMPSEKDLQTVSVALRDILKIRYSRLAVLSGPNIAVDVAANFAEGTKRHWSPVVSVLGSTGEFTLRKAGSLLHYPGIFRIYTCKDIKGIELCGILKQVYSIAMGLCDGLGFSTSTRSSLRSRCVAEIRRLIHHIRLTNREYRGVKESTFDSPAGYGDFDVTSNNGRNRMVGVWLAEGASVNRISFDLLRGGVAEGIHTTRLLWQYVSNANVHVPVLKQVYEVIWKGKPPIDAAKACVEAEQPGLI